MVLQGVVELGDPRAVVIWCITERVSFVCLQSGEAGLQEPRRDISYTYNVASPQVLGFYCAVLFPLRFRPLFSFSISSFSLLSNGMLWVCFVGNLLGTVQVGLT